MVDDGYMLISEVIGSINTESISGPRQVTKVNSSQFEKYLPQ